MKLLCLHGRGTYSGVLETQIDGIRQLLPDDYEYIFVDGEKEHSPAPGVEKVFAGPYLSYLTDYATKSMAEQHEYIMQIVEEEGPFDAVLGFSQGAALAASILLHHQAEQPFSPPPFRVAIFICSIYCYSRSPTMGVDVTDKVPAFERPEPIDSRDSSEEDLLYQSVRRLTPDSIRYKLQIPTAHIYGAQDPLLNESLDLVKMCDVEFASTFKHEGGHEIPMDVETNMKIRDVIETAIGKSQMLS